MPTLMHELASAPPTHHLHQQPRYASTPATTPPQSSILTLTILMLPPCPHDIPPMLPHPSLCFGTTPRPQDFPPTLPLHVRPHLSLCSRTPA
ncbi:hypothetical protein O181_027430 [Austropuccinia psidii MF-1]|uniref:Uncharacterized protein n=1 Tax=Austropuccinia psidii MF-1 TaxID=1389203 RepID=A0A9Q3CRC7_9BASI|nr:hypothetical protein [Austropuccinia psidii MF-1]